MQSKSTSAVWETYKASDRVWEAHSEPPGSTFGLIFESFSSLPEAIFGSEREFKRWLGTSLRKGCIDFGFHRFKHELKRAFNKAHTETKGTMRRKHR